MAPDPHTPPEQHGDAALAVREQLMAEFSVRYNGRDYLIDGQRCARFADALAHARRVQARRLQQDRAHPITLDRGVARPSAQDRALMASLAIAYETGVYAFAGFRYERLADAIDFASMRRGSATAGSSG